MRKFRILTILKRILLYSTLLSYSIVLTKILIPSTIEVFTFQPFSQYSSNFLNEEISALEENLLSEMVFPQLRFKPIRDYRPIPVKKIRKNIANPSRYQSIKVGRFKYKKIHTNSMSHFQKHDMYNVKLKQLNSSSLHKTSILLSQLEKSIQSSDHHIEKFKQNNEETLHIASLPSDQVELKQASSYKENDLTFFDYSPKYNQKFKQKIQQTSSLHAESDVEIVDVEDLLSEDSVNSSSPVKYSSNGALLKKSDFYPVILSQNSLTSKNTKNSLIKKDTKNAISKTSTSRIKINAVATDLEKVWKVHSFEVRSQDTDLHSLTDLGENQFTDYGNGEIFIQDRLSYDQMTRSMVALKKGYIPTNLSLNFHSSHSTVPLMEQEKFFQLREKFKEDGPIGAVLVDVSHIFKVELEKPYQEVINLSENLLVSNEKTPVYKLFLGVPAGNMIIKYEDLNQNKSSKIIHIHENEITFDVGHIGETKEQKITFVEENLLSKEVSPLILSKESIKEFFEYENIEKLGQNIFKTKFHDSANRNYLELNHLREPIYVGYQNNSHIEVPSEELMGQILSHFKDSYVKGSCLIQVNLKKIVSSFDMSSESNQNNLFIKTKILDSDGKFYRSIGPKSQKIVILGQDQSGKTQNSGAKINIKLKYLDGTSEYLSSYCSPNTYIVEQL